MLGVGGDEAISGILNIMYADVPYAVMKLCSGTSNCFRDDSYIAAKPEIS